MSDSIRLIMEETGCDEGQALLALESCNYDISKSIAKIYDLLKDIVILKCKFQSFNDYIFGLITIALNINTKSLLRVKALATYNPNIYESDLSQNWYEYEKKLYTARLMIGSLQDVTLAIEAKISADISEEYKKSFFDAVMENDIMEISDIIEDILRVPLKSDAVGLEIQPEQINLGQFKKITDKDINEQLEFDFTEYSLNISEPLSINVEPISSGTPQMKASLLIPGDEINVFINDSRDIAQYLSGLLSGGKANVPIAIPVRIQKVERDKNKIIITIRLAAGIAGKAVVDESSQITVSFLAEREGLFKLILLRFYLIFSKIFGKIKSTKDKED